MDKKKLQIWECWFITTKNFVGAICSSATIRIQLFTLFVFRKEILGKNLAMSFTMIGMTGGLLSWVEELLSSLH
jgi:hypothetical protein